MNMKQLKVILGIIYPILIILLCLSNCKGCKNSRETSGSTEDPIDTTRVVEEPVDTASVVEQAQHTGQSGNLRVILICMSPNQMGKLYTIRNQKICPREVFLTWIIEMEVMGRQKISSGLILPRENTEFLWFTIRHLIKLMLVSLEFVLL